TIGILVGELVTNAVKHAFTGRERGLIEVILRRGEEGVPELAVVDDGVGLPGELPPGDGPGLGSVIVKQLAMQFGGEPRYERLPQGGLRVVVPLPDIEGAAKPTQE